MSRRHSLIANLVAAVALLVTCLGAQAAEEADTARDWLQKMGNALEKENYQGIFTYMRGHQFDTVRVIHRYKNGKESERLLHLNGERREVIREDGKLICKHPKSAHVDLEHELLMGPFTHSFNENLAAYQNLYRFSLHGDDRIADRPAIKVGITPRYDDRYGYRLWLDKETGLLLQSHLVNQGRVLEVFQFSQVEIGQPVKDEALQTALSSDAVTHPLTAAVPEKTTPDEKPNWRVSWVPDGFKAVRMPESNRLLFTDGLATFSVFIDKNSPADLPELTAHMGGTVVISKKLKGSEQHITVVGEVPTHTAKRVAESVEPVVY